MTWKNAGRDGLPENKQEVLITVNGVNYPAIYNATNKSFEIGNGVIFKVSDSKSVIYWQEKVSPTK